MVNLGVTVEDALKQYAKVWRRWKDCQNPRTANNINRQALSYIAAVCEMYQLNDEIRLLCIHQYEILKRRSNEEEIQLEDMGQEGIS